jgi:dihydrofolate reductase
MGDVVLYIATSLDGAIARADDRIDWLFDADDYGFARFLGRVGVAVMGRRTFDAMRGFGAWPYGETPAFVFAHHTPPDVPEGWPVRFVSGALAPVFADLRQQRRGDIWLIGGGELVADALSADLVDRLVLSVHPLLIGPGRPLVAHPIPDRAFAFERVETFADGLVQLSYHRR